MGSGFLVSADGKIITNYHVIKGANSAIVKLTDGAFFPVKGVLTWDADKDLAVIKVTGKNLPFLELANSDGVPVGTHVVAIGSPLGLEGTVSDGIVSAMRFTRQSQSCTAGSRLFLHKKIFDPFLAALEAKTSKLKIGDPLDEASDVGTIINEKQFRKVCGYVEDGLKRRDARVVFGGLPPKEGPLSQGYFAVPTVFADASNDWRLAREEIFGPVLVAIPWEDEEEAIRMANDSHYGLAAYVWTHDISTGLRTAHAIESGWVQVNQGLGQVPGHSYGGYKQSGIGREFSLEGMLDSFTQRKNVTVSLTAPARA